MNTSKNKVALQALFANQLKTLKKTLPKSCTYLSALKTVDGEFRVKAIVNGKEYLYTTPQDLIFKEADLRELARAISEKC